MAKTVFAGEEVKKFTDENILSLSASALAKFTGFFKYIFMSNRPCYAGNGNGQ